MCSGLVEMKVWMRGRSAAFKASAQRSISGRVARERPQTVAFFTRFAISRTASKSPLDAIGKPASMMSTPISSRTSEMRSFSSIFIDAPGDCSPSRRVVSKMKTRSGSFVLLMGLVPSSTQVDCGEFAVSAPPERRSRTNARALGRSGAPKSKAPAEAGQKCRQVRDTAPLGGPAGLARIADAIVARAHRWCPCSGAALPQPIRLVEPHKASASARLSIGLSNGLFLKPKPGGRRRAPILISCATCPPGDSRRSRASWRADARRPLRRRVRRRADAWP